MKTRSAGDFYVSHQRRSSKLVRYKIALLASLLTITAHAADSYTPYENGRFGFRVDVPTNLFSPQGESDNGDGQIFSYKDGIAEMRAYGGWLMEPDIPCSASSIFDQETANTTYSHSKGRVSVASGHTGNNIFYVKTIRTSDRCLNLVITYPSQDRATFDAIVKRVSRSFDG